MLQDVTALISVTDCCSNGQVEYSTSNLFLCEAEKRKTDNFCAKLAVGSLFGQYHNSNILNIPMNL